MPRSARSRHSTDSRPSLYRFGFALAVSALAHGLLLTATGDSPWRRWASYPASVPITVRLETPPVYAPDVTVASAPEAHQVPLAAPRSTVRTEQSPQRDPLIVGARTAPEASALPRARDPHYYAARDLDHYPWPLVPLQLEHLAEARSELRLELLIDEAGIVQEVVFVQPARTGEAEEKLRTALIATHFMPGRKEGRPVKSRLLMGINLGIRSP